MKADHLYQHDHIPVVMISILAICYNIFFFFFFWNESDITIKKNPMALTYIPDGSLLWI